MANGALGDGPRENSTSASLTNDTLSPSPSQAVFLNVLIDARGRRKHIVMGKLRESLPVTLDPVRVVCGENGVTNARGQTCWNF